MFVVKAILGLFLFTVPQFLRRGWRRTYLPNPAVRVTMQADNGIKMLPVQAGNPFPAKGGERF